MRAATPSIFLRNSRRLSSRAQIVLGRGAIEQEFQIRTRPLELGDKRVASVLLDERVGVFAARQLNYVDVEAFAYQQLRSCVRRRVCPARSAS